MIWVKLDLSDEKTVKKFCLDVFNALSTHLHSGTSEIKWLQSVLHILRHS